MAMDEQDVPVAPIPEEAVLAVPGGELAPVPAPAVAAAGAKKPKRARISPGCKGKLMKYYKDSAAETWSAEHRIAMIRKLLATPVARVRSATP